MSIRFISRRRLVLRSAALLAGLPVAFMDKPFMWGAAHAATGGMQGDFPPGVTALEYRVHLENFGSGPVLASMRQQFSREGERYDLRSEAQAQGLLALVWKGSMNQHSQGRIGPGGLVPERFGDRRGKRAPRGATIDEAGGITLLDGRRIEAGRPGTQDRLSAFAQLGWLLAKALNAASGAPEGTIFEFPLLATSTVGLAQWRLEGFEQIDVGNGAVQAVKVRRQLAPGSSETAIDVWFDPARLPWPLRMRLSETDQPSLDQVLVSIDSRRS